MAEKKYTPIKGNVGMVGKFFETLDDDTIHWFLRERLATLRIGLATPPTLEEVQAMDEDELDALLTEIRTLNRKHFQGHPQFAEDEKKS